MEFLLTISVTGIVIIAIIIFKEHMTRKVEDQVWEKYIEKDKIRTAQRDALYAEKVEVPLQQYYDELSASWHRPDSPLPVDRLRFNTEAGLQHAQATLPNEWFLWADDCDCWIYDNALYILEQLSSVKVKAENYPEQFDTEEKIKSRLFHICIPLDKIHYFKEAGELIHSQHTVLPGSSSYTGVSVDGIAFGEMKHTPEVTVPKILESRYITLYYHIDGETALQSLYFGHDSWNTLVRLIPYLEKF